MGRAFAGVTEYMRLPDNRKALDELWELSIIVPIEAFFRHAMLRGSRSISDPSAALRVTAGWVGAPVSEYGAGSLAPLRTGLGVVDVVAGVELDAAAVLVEVEAVAEDIHVPESAGGHEYSVFVHVVFVAGVFVGAVFAGGDLYLSCPRLVDESPNCPRRARRGTKGIVGAPYPDTASRRSRRLYMTGSVIVQLAWRWTSTPPPLQHSPALQERSSGW